MGKEILKFFGGNGNKGGASGGLMRQGVNPSIYLLRNVNMLKYLVSRPSPSILRNGSMLRNVNVLIHMVERRALSILTIHDAPFSKLSVFHGGKLETLRHKSHSPEHPPRKRLSERLTQWQQRAEREVETIEDR